jgi:hypothetical protein
MPHCLRIVLTKLHTSKNKNRSRQAFSEVGGPFPLVPRMYLRVGLSCFCKAQAQLALTYDAAIDVSRSPPFLQACVRRTVEADFASLSFRKKDGEATVGVIAGMIDQLRDLGFYSHVVGDAHRKAVEGLEERTEQFIRQLESGT